MPLDSSTISPTAKARLRNSAFGLYGSIAHVIGLAADPLNAGLPTYTPGMYLPLLKSYYSPTTDFGKKIDYNNKLTQILGSRDYGIFSHASGDAASDCYYAVIKGLTGSHRFSALYKNPTVAGNNSIKFLDFIKSQNPNSYYYASTGSFHTDISLNEMVEGAFAVNNVVFPLSLFPYLGNTAGTAVQFDVNAHTANTFVYKNATQSPVSSGDGFSTLISFLSPTSGLLRDGYFDGTGRKSTSGIAMLVYNRPQDLLFSIIRRHRSSVNIDEIADMLEVLEFTDGVFCDGSDSVFIADYESPFDSRLLIDNMWPHKNLANGGLKLAFAIKKQP
jgi:hypothetical protein